MGYSFWSTSAWVRSAIRECQKCQIYLNRSDARRLEFLGQVFIFIEITLSKTRHVLEKRQIVL